MSLFFIKAEGFSSKFFLFLNFVYDRCRYLEKISLSGATSLLILTSCKQRKKNWEIRVWKLRLINHKFQAIFLLGNKPFFGSIFLWAESKRIADILSFGHKPKRVDFISLVQYSPLMKSNILECSNQFIICKPSSKF